ncbi:MAG: DUF362 domain-containing protein [Lentisphaeria bacterium]
MYNSNAVTFSRRNFIRTALAGAAAWSLPGRVFAADKPNTDVWVIHGEDKSALMKKALEIVQERGGFSGGVGQLALKVNAAWARKPAIGANTHPDLVAAFVRGAKRAGVKNVVLPENSCARPEQSFTRSGIQQAAEETGARMINLKKEKQLFTDVDIPDGKSLTKAQVAKPFLESDLVVNMPVAKHHGGAKLTIAMKNWMGAVQDRGFWHRNNLHQCIADFSTFMKPQWSIVDATRIMLSRGPQGPSRDMKRPDLLIVSADQVAADSVAAALFHDNPQSVKYLRMAHEMGIGTVDHKQMNIHQIEM